MPLHSILLASVLTQAIPEPAPRPSADDPPESVRFEDVPAPFVPKTPMSVADRSRIEATRKYVAARALEDQGKLPEAIALLRESAEDDPDSTAILKRIARLQRNLGDLENAAETSRAVLALDPDDGGSQIILVSYLLERKQSPTDAATLLRSLLDDPKLDPKSAGAILAHRLLGDLLSTLLDDRAGAAREYEAVIDAVDSRASRDLSALDFQRIFRGAEADAYLQFGAVFLSEERFESAIRAFKRGIAVDPSHGQIPRLLAEALLRAGRADEALVTLEAYLKKQPQGREPYELLGEILETTGQAGEFLPRLERAAEADRENLALQFALAERLRADGREADAEALLEKLLADEGDPRVFGPLAESLRRTRQAAPLARVLRDAFEEPGGPDAVRPVVERIADDPEFAAEVLEAAEALFAAEPADFGEAPRRAFGFIATRAKLAEHLTKLDRLAVDRDPSPSNYREWIIDLFRDGKHAESAAAVRELFEKHPGERNALLLDLLARNLFLSGQVRPALEVATEASGLEPNDPELMFLIGYLRGRLGEHDEAVAQYRKIIDQFPGNEEVERRVRAGLSATYEDMGQPDRAEAELEQAYEQAPDDPGINNDLGYLYADHGKNLERAEAMIRMAVEAEPENNSFLDSYGWVLFKLGRLDEALTPLEKAAEDSAVSATVLDHLGDVYYGLRRYDDAEKSWRKAETLAKESAPPDDRLEAIRAKLEELKALVPAAESGSEPD